MADGVQFVLDRMAPTFRQMEELEVFERGEVKSIVKKRTDFEYVLKRRQLTVGDFYKYLEYEVQLEKLLCLRCERNFGGEVNASGKLKSRQDGLRNLKTAAIRHICTIFDRAIRRFPNEFDLLMDYVNFLKEHKSNSILNEVFGRALALHPKQESLWLQAAVHELEENNNVHAARVLLQTALRANNKSKTLWAKYFDLELWNASRIYQRQEVLKDKKGNGGRATKEDVSKEEEDDHKGLLAAPQVVFKHALQATNDAGLACEMHLSSKQVSDSLAQSLSEQLKENFGGQAIIWCHFIDLAIREEEFALVEEVTQELGVRGAKRKRTAADRASITALSKCRGVKGVLRQFLDSQAVTTGIPAKDMVLESFASFTRHLWLLLTEKCPIESLDADICEALTREISDMDDIVRTIATLQEPEALSLLPSKAHFARGRFYLCTVREALSKIAEHSASAPLKAQKKTRPSNKKVVPKDTTDAFQGDNPEDSKGALLAWLEQQGQYLIGEANKFGNASQNLVIFRRAARAWLDVACLACEFLGIELQLQSIGDDNDEDDEDDEDDKDDGDGDGKGATSKPKRRVSDDDADSLRKRVCKCLCDNATISASLEEAPAVFKALRGIDSTVVSEERVGEAMLSALSCPLCPSNVRGMLCLDYVTWVVSLPREEPRTAVVKRAHQLVTQRVLQVPTLVARAGIEYYYQGMADLVQEICREEITALEGVQNPYLANAYNNLASVSIARDILEAGIARNSSDGVLWDARERIESEYARDTNKAKQVRLRRSHHFV